MAEQGKAHIWDILEIGDASLPHVYEVTAGKIADYCRAVRYENLAYTNQPAAREMGLPGIITPPAMALVYAPARLAELMAARGRLSIHQWQQSLRDLAFVNIVIQFQGVMVEPGDVITSVTSAQDKFRRENDRFITMQVTARNQRNELVAECQYIYRCPENLE